MLTSDPVQAQCQEEEDGGDLNDLSEYDSVLVECGGSVLGPLAGAVGGGVFLIHLPEVLPQLLTKLVSTCRVTQWMLVSSSPI